MLKVLTLTLLFVQSSLAKKGKGMETSEMSETDSSGKGKGKMGMMGGGKMSGKDKGKGYYVPVKPVFEEQVFGFRTVGTGDQETIPVMTDTVSVLELTVDEGFTFMDYSLKVFYGMGITLGHLHCDKAGMDGDVIVEFYENLPNGTDVHGHLASGSLTADDITNTTMCGSNIASLFQAMKDGMVYLNVHSAEYPAGVNRGQVMLFPYH